MNNPLKSNGAGNLGLLLARIPLGAMFLMQGISKIARIGVKSFVEDNTKHLPDFLPKPIGQTYLYAVPFFEVAVGALILFGLFTRTAATVASLMLISFMIAVTGVVANDKNDFPQVTPTLVFFGAAFLLATTGAGKMSLDRAFFGPDELYR